MTLKMRQLDVVSAFSDHPHHCPSGPSLNRWEAGWGWDGHPPPDGPHLEPDQTTTTRRGSLPLALLAQRRGSLIADLLLSKVILFRIFLSTSILISRRKERRRDSWTNSQDTKTSRWLSQRGFSPARFCCLLDRWRSRPPLEWSSAFFFKSFQHLFPYFFNARLCKQLVEIFCGLRRIQYLINQLIN